MVPTELARSCFCVGIYARFFCTEGNNWSLLESPRARERAMDVLCRSPSAWRQAHYAWAVRVRKLIVKIPRFADDIGGLPGIEEERATLVNHIHIPSARYHMGISATKAKLPMNTTKPTERRITVSGPKLETVAQFKNLGAIISKEGSKSEVLARDAWTAMVLAKREPLWKDKDITLSCKF